MDQSRISREREGKNSMNPVPSAPSPSPSPSSSSSFGTSLFLTQAYLIEYSHPIIPIPYPHHIQSGRSLGQKQRSSLLPLILPPSMIEDNDNPAPENHFPALNLTLIYGFNFPALFFLSSIPVFFPLSIALFCRMGADHAKAKIISRLIRRVLGWGRGTKKRE